MKLLFSILFVILISVIFAASIPDGINYQGKLFEDGGPVDGETRDFRFRLFTDVNGDGKIRMDDLWLVAIHFGESYPSTSLSNFSVTYP